MVSIDVTSPDGGEVWYVGTDHDIEWTSDGITDVKIEYSTNNGTYWNDIVASVPASDESYPWTVPDSVSTDCLVRISDASDGASDISNAVFEIRAQTVTVTLPNGGEIWYVSASRDIEWTSEGIDSVEIEYSKNSGGLWTVVGKEEASLGSYSWEIPSGTSTSCLVRVSDLLDGTPADASDNVFQVKNQSLVITSPDGGEIWYVGASHDIGWTSEGIDNVKIEYSTNGGSNWIEVTATMPDTGSYAWTVPDTPSDNCLVRISDASDGVPSDQSKKSFEIRVQTLTVGSPNGGEVWYVATSEDIEWTSEGIDTVKIEYSTNGGSNWIEVTASTPAGTGSYPWTVPDTPTTDGLVRISDALDDTPLDESDAVFEIKGQSVTVSSPNGTEIWYVGTSHDIEWTSEGIDDVKIEYSTNGGSNWIEVTASTPAGTGSYPWTVPNTPSPNCLVRILDALDDTPADVSDAIFEIKGQSITVSSPNGTETWYVGTSHDIEWTSEGIDNVKIEYSTNGGSNWIEVTASTPAGTGSYPWTVPDTPTTDGLVRISDALDDIPSDESNAVFEIRIQSIEVTSPDGGQVWYVSTSNDIAWTSEAVDSVEIEYSTDGGGHWLDIGNADASDGSYAWRVPDAPSMNCLVRISDLSDGTPSDVSDAVFEIKLQSVAVGSPNDGEVWCEESSHNIQWTPDGIDSVKIEYSTDEGSNWNDIETSVPAANQSYSWGVPHTPSPNCLVKISDAYDGDPSDESDAVFEIKAQTIDVTAPKTGDVLCKGYANTMTWQSTCVDSVKIEYSVDGGPWILLKDCKPNAGSQNWVPSVASDHFLLRISDCDGSPQAVSDEFTVIDPGATLALEDPEDSSTGVSLNPTFVWTSVPNALSYGIEVALDPFFSNVVYSREDLHGATHQVGNGLLGHSVYYWHVKVKTQACDWSDWIDHWSFETVNSAPWLEALRDTFVYEDGDSLEVLVTAHDDDAADSLILSAELQGKGSLPEDADFYDNHNGTGRFVFAPDHDHVASGTKDYIIVFSAKDSSTTGSDASESDDATVTYTVINVNRSPELDPIGPKGLFEGQSLSCTVSADDSDGTTPDLAVYNNPPNSDFNPTTGEFTFNPDFDQGGAYDVIFEASDDSSEENEDADSLTVEIAVHRLDPRYIDFGTNLVGSCSTITIVTHNSSPTQTLSIDHVEHNWNIEVNHYPGTIGPGESDTSAFSFCPKSVGTDTQGIWFHPEAMDSIRVRYHGVGVQYNLAISPGTLSFDPCNVGETSLPRTVTITNEGQSTGITSVTIEDNDGDSLFFIESDDCSGNPLGYGQVCSFDVRYSPVSQGFDTGWVSIAFDGRNLDSCVLLSGQGVEPELILNRHSIVFEDSVRLGKESDPETVWVSNGKDGFLEINRLGLSDSTNFQLEDPMNVTDTTISGDDSVFFLTIFSPWSGGYEGYKHDTVVVLSNGGNELVSLKGYALTPEWRVVVPDGNSFGGVLVDTEATKESCYVENISMVPPFVVYDIELLHRTFFDLDLLGTLPDTLYKDPHLPSEFYFDCSFAPDMSLKEDSTVSDTIVIRFHSLGVPSDTTVDSVIISGTGIAPLISVESPDTIEFDSTLVPNRTPYRTIILRNAGSYGLIVDTIFVSDAVVFPLDRAEGFDWHIGRDLPREFGVAFRPTEARTFFDSISIISNAYNTSASFDETTTVYLSGKGYVIDEVCPTITNLAPDTSTQGRQADILAHVTDNLSGVDSVELHYRLGDDDEFDTLVMARAASDTFKATISSGSVTLSGLEYEIWAADSAGNDCDTGIFPLRVRFHNVSQHSSLWYHSSNSIDSRWILFSIPGELDQNSLDPVLTEDLGPPGEESWKVVGYDDGGYQYYETPGSTPFGPGRGFWFKCINSDNDFRVRAGSGTTVPTSVAFSIVLDANNWNIISNPFFFDLDVYDLIYSNASLEGPYWFDRGAAHSDTAGWVFPVNLLDPPGSGSVLYLEPWKGYAVKNKSGSDITLLLDPHATASRKSEGTPAPAADFLWRVRLLAGAGISVDEANLGSSESCSELEDVRDFLKPPHVEPGVLVYFPRPNWGESSGDYATDYRGVIDEGTFWDFAVDNYTDSKELQLSWEGIASLPSEFEAVLYDRMKNVTVDMRKQGGYSFTHFQNRDYNRFRIFVGRSGYVEEEISSVQAGIPKEFKLRQNYPNPFNAGTAISFDLPQGCHVKVKIYNILGQSVVTLYDEPAYPGKHTIFWDGKDTEGDEVSSGVYFCRLSAPGFNKSMKMLLLK